MFNRRNFIKSTALVSLASLAGAHKLMAMPSLLNNIGIQLFSIPQMLSEDFEGGLEMLSSIGFKEIELFGPYPFSDEKNIKQWAGAAAMLGFSGSGYFGKSRSEVKALMQKYGFKVPAMHTDMDTLSTKMPELAEAANSLGAKYVVLPSIPDEKRQNLDGYKRVAEEFNKIGEEAKKHGVRFAYHNHGYGFHEMDGKIPMDIIFDETDPKLVYFEMDLFWTTAAGADPVKLLKEHKGRYKLMHVKDMTEKKRFSGDGGDASQWFVLFPFMASAGEGVLDLPAILSTAKKNGVEHFFVEQDMVKKPEGALDKSFKYLKSV
ncbi:MAG TPA: sugar phosphate isomerase/epimerase [Anditalea sp.]|nr:sugar phosphate isomerase/epimerase [Anditalea sp.]